MVLVMGNGQQHYHMCHCTGTVCCVLINTTSLGCSGGLFWGADCRFSGPYASCSSGECYLRDLLASGMGSHLAVRDYFATMAIITSIPVLGGRDYLRPLAWRSKACIICHHALGGCWLSVQFSYGHSFRWVGRGHGVAMAGMFRLRVVPALGGTNGWGCRFSGPHASCSSGGRYLHDLLASGMGSHLAVRD